MIQFEKILFNFFILYFLSGCYYPKVKLTRSERKLIAYDKQKRPIIFCSGEGICDTIHFSNAFTRNGYNPNFDQWYDIKLIHTTKPGTPRGFYYSVNGTSNFPANKYTNKNLNLSIELFLIKSDNDKPLTLLMHGFKEEFVIDEKTKDDTLIFAEHTPEVTCPTGQCLRKAYWTTKQGLIRLEKYDGSIWLRKE